MLTLNLAKIRTAEEQFEREYAPEALAAERDMFRIVSPVTLAFDLRKDKNTFHLVGRVNALLELPCSRCLEPYQIAVDSPFDLRYQPRSADEGGGEHEIAADDIDTAYYDNDEIDLRQLMLEQFYLVVPMKPLCGDECRGLCPTCGTNLNKASCGCDVHWDDPRLAALKSLKKES